MLAIVRLILEFPPIGSRNYDFRAFVEGEEEQNRCGWGATEEAALDDLMSQESESEG